MAEEQLLAKLRWEFERMDKNGDGSLSADELHWGLLMAGWDQDEVAGIFEIIDTDGDGRVTLEEFVKYRQSELRPMWDSNAEEARKEQIRKLRQSLSECSSEEEAQTLNREIVQQLRGLEEYRVGIRNMGLSEASLTQLKLAFWNEGHHETAPFVVIPGEVFMALTELPRRSDENNQTIYKPFDPSRVCIFISHVWFEPSLGHASYNPACTCAHADGKTTRNQECPVLPAHPDFTSGDCAALKMGLIAEGIRRLLADFEDANPDKITLDMLDVWLDFGCIDQDNPTKMIAGVKSLLAYVLQCKWILIPGAQPLRAGGATVDRVPGIDDDPKKQYGRRAWTRAESMAGFMFSVLRQEDQPPIYNICKENSEYVLTKLQYSLDPEHLPDAGELTKESDRVALTAMTQKLLSVLKKTVDVLGYVARHADEVQAVAFHPQNNRLVLSCGKDKAVKLTNVDSGTVRGVIKGHNCRDGCTCKPKERKKNEVEEVDPACPVKGHSKDVHCVAFSSDGSLFATGSADGMVKVWETSSFQEKATLDSKGRTIACLAFSPDGKSLLSGGSTWIIVWDTEAMSITKELRASAGGRFGPLSVKFSPDGKYFASGLDGGVKVWSCETFEETTIVSEPTSSKAGTPSSREPWPQPVLYCADFSPDGRWLATTNITNGLSGKIQLWDVATWTEHPSGWFGKGVLGVAWSPDSQLLLTGGSELNVWDVAVEKPCLKATLSGHAKTVNAVCFSSDGKYMASGGADRKVRLWETASLESYTAKEGHTKKISCLAMSPDGKLVASGSLDSKAILWDAESMAQRECFTANSDAVIDLAFSPDSRYLAYASKGCHVMVWPTEKDTKSLPGGFSLDQPVKSVKFSSDGKFVLAKSDATEGNVKVWVYSVEEREIRQVCQWNPRDNPNQMRYVGDGPHGFEPALTQDVLELFRASASGRGPSRCRVGRYEIISEGRDGNLLIKEIQSNQRGSETIASFRLPQKASAICCSGERVVVACGNELHNLLAPLLLLA